VVVGVVRGVPIVAPVLVPVPLCRKDITCVVVISTCPSSSRVGGLGIHLGTHPSGYCCCSTDSQCDRWGGRGVRIVVVFRRGVWGFVDKRLGELHKVFFSKHIILAVRVPIVKTYYFAEVDKIKPKTQNKSHFFGEKIL